MAGMNDFFKRYSYDAVKSGPMVESGINEVGPVVSGDVIDPRDVPSPPVVEVKSVVKPVKKEDEGVVSGHVLEGKVGVRVAAIEVHKWLRNFKGVLLVGFGVIFVVCLLTLFNLVLGCVGVLGGCVFFGFHLLRVRNEMRRLEVKYNL
jgi:hypothetical protein